MSFVRSFPKMLSPGMTLAALLATIAPFAASAAETPLATIPAGTVLRFHVTEPISSNESKTGEPFTFVLLSPIVDNGRIIVPEGATGVGTVFLAGHAGGGGHEGDLTLRIDSAHTADGHLVTFADQRFEVNGRNRKIASNALGVVPYVGFFSGFIRGSEVRVTTDRPIETQLLRPATIIEDTTASAAPPAITSPSPSATKPKS